MDIHETKCPVPAIPQTFCAISTSLPALHSARAHSLISLLHLILSISLVEGQTGVLNPVLQSERQSAKDCVLCSVTAYGITQIQYHNSGPPVLIVCSPNALAPPVLCHDSIPGLSGSGSGFTQDIIFSIPMTGKLKICVIL